MGRKVRHWKAGGYSYHHSEGSNTQYSGSSSTSRSRQKTKQCRPCEGWGYVHRNKDGTTQAVRGLLDRLLSWRTCPDCNGRGEVLDALEVK